MQPSWIECAVRVVVMVVSSCMGAVASGFVLEVTFVGEFGLKYGMDRCLVLDLSHQQALISISFFINRMKGDSIINNVKAKERISYLVETTESRGP
jgi:hypothetical protein